MTNRRTVSETLHEFIVHYWRAQPRATRALRGVLTIRAALGVLFGLLLLASTRLHWGGVFDWFSAYAIADGLLALLLATGFVIASRADSRLHRLALPALGLCDALIRLGAGVAIREWPGIPYFPVTSVLFLSTIGALTAWVSVIELGVLAAIERRTHWPLRSILSPRVALIAAAAIPMLLLGSKLLLAPPSTVTGLRLMFSLYALATSGGLAIAAFRSGDDERRRVQRPALIVVSNVRRPTLRLR